MQYASNSKLLHEPWHEISNNVVCATSKGIHADWSEPLLVAWTFSDCYATDQTSFGIFKLKRRLYRLIWVYICQNVTLLEITCRGSHTCTSNTLQTANWFASYDNLFVFYGEPHLVLTCKINLPLASLAVKDLCWLFLCSILQSNITINMIKH